MYRKKGRGWTKHIDFMLIDIACIVIALFISYVIRFGFNNPYMDKDYRILGVAFLLIDFFVEIMADSFKNVLKRGYLDEFISTCKHAVLVFLVTALFLFTTQMADIYSRLSFYIMFPIYVTITYVARLALKSFLKKKGFGASKKSLFVIAPDAMLRDTLRTVEKSCIGYTKIVAASLDTDMKGKTICGIPIVANHDGIVDYACDEWVDEVLIPPCSEDEYPEKMADIFLEMGIAVHTGIAKNGTAQGGYKQIEKIGDYTVVTSSVNYANTSALLVKRGMDIVGGLVGCLFTLIIMIFVGPAIYIASPGPIFFSQERVGRNGRKFKMYKFRSMYMDAEERKKELMAQNKVGDGMMFKMDFDPRIIGNKVLPNGKKKTGIGQFIRKTSLDEFPQFFNILKGDMSLVGTRPPTLDEWEKYEPHHRARMSFRPGLTGLWQVSGRSNITDFEEVVKLDTQYIGEWSVKGDISILFKTVMGVLKNKGLYNKTNDPVLTTNTTISKDYNYAAFNNNMGVSFIGGSLVLNSGTDLKLYYSMDDKNMANNINVSVNGQNVAPEYDGNIMCVRVPDISISSLGDTYNVKISVNGKEMNQKYSAMTYMYKALNSQNSNTKLNNVVKALYIYNEAAKQYSMGIE